MFFVVGAQKAGTTMIHTWLKQEGCRLPRYKETCFFSNEEVHNFGLDWYKKNFSGDGVEGEIDPECLYSPSAARLIKNFYPNAKIVIVIRDPIERANSHYNMTVLRGMEDRNFYEAVNQEYKEKENSIYHSHLSYIDRGMYVSQIERYFENFNKENILIIKFDALFSSTERQNEYARLCHFIGVRASVDITNSFEKANQASEPRLAYINKLIWKRSEYGLVRKFIRVIFPTKNFRDFLARKIVQINKKNKKNNLIDYSLIDEKIKADIVADLKKLELLTDINCDDWIKRYL